MSCRKEYSRKNSERPAQMQAPAKNFIILSRRAMQHSHITVRTLTGQLSPLEILNRPPVPARRRECLDDSGSYRGCPFKTACRSNRACSRKSFLPNSNNRNGKDKECQPPSLCFHLLISIPALASFAPWRETNLFPSIQPVKTPSRRCNCSSARN